jgi:microcystin-dependent protein
MALPVRKGYKGAATNAVLTNNPTASAGDTIFEVDTVTGWSTTFPYFVVVDPGTSREEKVKVTAISSTLLTVVRAQDDTALAVHSAGAAVYPVFTADEADEANLIASAMTTKGDLIATDGSSVNRLGVGTNTHVLQADSSSTNGFKWGQVATAGIADNAVTAAKIASAVAGSGLAGGAGTALSVNVDDSTIEINSDTLRLKDSGVTLAKLAAAVANALVPVGTIAAYAGVTAPTGWLLCNGTSTTGYTSLAALVGATTPDMRGRFAIGDNATLTLLGTGGSLKVTEANLPSHSHTFSATSGAMSANATLGHTVNDPSHGHIINSTDISHIHYNAAEGTTSTAHTHNDSGNAGSINTGSGQTTGTDTTDGMTAGESHSHTGQAATTGISVNAHDVSHTHTVSGTTGTGSGSGTDYYPPHLVVNYIIKHD